jgi:arsenate reductase
MLTIYHNNRCSKSRAALAYLESLQQPVQVVFYLETPPDVAQIRRLLTKLGYSARQLLRDKEELYQQLGLADSRLTELQLIEAMANNPQLIERPIIEWPDKAVIARPLALLEAEFK